MRHSKIRNSCPRHMLRCTEVSQPIDAMGHELTRHLAERAAAMPQKPPRRHATRAAEAGQSRHFATQKNSETLRRSPLEETTGQRYLLLRHARLTKSAQQSFQRRFVENEVDLSHLFDRKSGPALFHLGTRLFGARPVAEMA